ncbi:MAG: flagellar hook-associated protein FlgK [Geminicoccaceae bacterium]
MSLSATLNTALSGLSVAQRALSVTANNVANANTEGYTRKQLNQATNVLDGQSQGVRSAETSRVVDQFLNSELRRQTSSLAMNAELSEAYARIELGLFGSPGDAERGLAAQLGTLTAGLEQLANEPESRALRTSVVGAIEDALRQLTQDTTTVQQLRAEADQEIGRTVQAINSDLEELHTLNREITRTGGTADLADRRDQVLEQLAEKIEISIYQKDNGTIAVYTSGGHALLESAPSQLHYTPSSSVSDTTQFGAISMFTPNQIDPATGAPFAGAVGDVLVTGGRRAVLTPELQALAAGDPAISEADLRITSPLGGGALQGLLEVRDRVLPELGDQLDETARMLAFALNAAHNSAMPYPLPTQVDGTRQDFTDYATATRSGTASLVVFDSAGAVAADVTIDLAAAGTPADVVAQINAQLGGTGTAALDPADGSLQVTLGVDGTGGAYRLAWEEGTSSITPTTVPDRGWSYGFAHYFGLNDLVVSTGGRGTDLAVRADIATDSSLLANVVLDRSGPTPTVGGAGDKRGLQALAGALDHEIQSAARGGLPASKGTVSGYLSNLTSLVASQSAQAANREAADRSMVEDLQFRQGSISGVNLDEEMSKLVLYQQAYSVSARLISITNELFGELVNMTR